MLYKLKLELKKAKLTLLQANWFALFGLCAILSPLLVLFVALVVHVWATLPAPTFVVALLVAGIYFAELPE
jgi:hypothetical protein